MKINKLFFVFVMSFLISGFCFGMQQQNVLKDFKFNTLSSWTTHCFKTLKEHSRPGWGFPNFTVGEKDFTASLDKLINKYSTSDLKTESLWAQGKAPEKEFFDAKINTQGESEELKKTGEKSVGEFYWPYVQKLQIPSESKVTMMGDYHGSIHSLLRNLWRLVSLGYLNDELRLQKGLKLIFLGDFVDSGRHGVEIWYTLCLLKLNNWDDVFILRGNHETYNQNESREFKPELRSRYNDKGQILSQFYKIYRFLPHALYLGPQVEKEKQFFVQCSHGGISCGKIDKNFEPKVLLDDQGEKKYLKISKYQGFAWSDFCQDAHVVTSGRGGPKSYVIGLSNTIKYLEDSGLKAFFRGHQDMAYGFKMFLPKDYKKITFAEYKTQMHKIIETFTEDQKVNFKAEIEALNMLKKFDSDSELKKLFPNILFFKGENDRPDRERYRIIWDYKKIGPGYINGPYHWDNIVSPEDQKEKDGFLINKYPPIFTFTSATEGKGVPYDCFGIVTVKDRYEDWRLKVYETYLEEGNADRNEKYVYLKQPSKDLTLANGVSDQLLAVEWKDEKPKDEDKVLDPKLFEAPRPKKLPQSPAMIYDIDGNPIISIYQDLSGEKKSKSLLEVPKRIEGAGGRRRPTSKRVIARSIEKLKKSLQVKSNYEASVELLKAIVKSSAGKEAFTEKLTQEGIIKDKIDSLFYDYLVYGGEVTAIDWDAVEKMIPHVFSDKVADTILELLVSQQEKAIQLLSIVKKLKIKLPKEKIDRMVNLVNRSDSDRLKNIAAQEILSKQKEDAQDSAYILRGEKKKKEEFQKKQAEAKAKFEQMKKQQEENQRKAEEERKSKEEELTKRREERAKLEGERKERNRIKKEQEGFESKLRGAMYENKSVDELTEWLNKLETTRKMAFVEEAEHPNSFRALFADDDIKATYTPDKKIEYFIGMFDTKKPVIGKKRSSLFEVLLEDKETKELIDQKIKDQSLDPAPLFKEVEGKNTLSYLIDKVYKEEVVNRFNSFVNQNKDPQAKILVDIMQEKNIQLSKIQKARVTEAAKRNKVLDTFPQFFANEIEQSKKDLKEKAAAAAAQAAQSPELDDLTNSLESLKATLSELSEEFGKLTQ